MSSPAAPVRAKLSRVVSASLAGNTIEFYDFSIYTLAATLIFPTLFFPGSDPVVATISSFATLAVGYVARPLGAVIFGHFGDRVGRKPVLVITLMMMGLVTTAIGLLPTYESWGTWAAVTLVALRTLQGVAFGGEWGGAILMAFEYAEPHQRGLFAAIPQAGPAAGTVLGNAAFLVVTLLPEEERFAWGWRIPFLLSAVLVVIGLVIRLKIAESPEFEKVKDRAAADDRPPLVSVLTEHWRRVLLVTLGALGFGAFSISIVAVLVGYGRDVVGVDPSVMLVATLVGTAVQIPMVLVAGHLSDRFGRRPMVVYGTVAAMGAIFLVTWGVLTGNAVLIPLAYGLGFGVLYSLSYGVQPALFAEVFPPTVRFTGMSLGYQGANVIGSGLTPIVVTILLHGTGSAWAVPFFVTATLLLALVALSRLARIADRERGSTAPSTPTNTEAVDAR